MSPRPCTAVPGAGIAPTSQEPGLGQGLGKVLEHSQTRILGSGGPALSGSSRRSSPSTSGSRICFWGTFVPNLSPVSWSYYKQVQSASPLLFR